MKHDTMNGLLHALRNRLWGTAVARHAHWGLWWAGVSVLALGMVHRWVWSVPLPLALAVPLVPYAALVAWGVARGRPELRTCASEADALFHGQELMISAFELRDGGLSDVKAQRNASTVTATLVRNRAATAAAGWIKRLSDLERPRYRITTPVSLACAGIFLLVNAGAPDAPTVSGSTETIAQTVTATAPNLSGTQPLDPELAEADARARPMVQGEAPGLPEDDDAGPTPLLLPDVSQPGINVPTQQEAGKLATAIRPVTRPDGTTELPDMDVEIIVVDAVQAASELLAGLGGIDADSSTDPGADPGAPLSAGPSTRGIGAEPSRLNQFPPAQRRYAAAYFQAQEESREERP